MINFPYPGLRPFKYDETDIFFGRDELTNQLIERLGDTHFIAVVGISGCGKSSLVRTGLLPGLERGLLASAGIRWRIAELRPGNHPFANLAEALLAETALRKEYTAAFIDDTAGQDHLTGRLKRGPLSLHELLQEEVSLPSRTNLLLVVDQFEELFRHYQRGEVDDTEAFIQLLLASSQPSAISAEADDSHRIYVVITMRSDFISDCAWFDGLPDAINQGLFLTPRLTREQLQEAIEGPAKVFGGQVESQLSSRLLNEMEKGPDQLPVLQHALMRMWHLAQADNAQQIILTEIHYDTMGGLKDALARHADEAYQELIKLVVPVEPQKVAEILFRRLCERDRARRDTRSPAKLAELVKLAKIPEAAWKQVADVVEVFRQTGRHFLTPPLGIPLKPDSVIDISHESLIHHWQLLKDWAEAEAESAKIYRRLEDTACLWAEKRAELWSGVELAFTLNWLNNEQPTAIWATRYGKEADKYFELAKRFLAESEQEQKRKWQEKEQQEREQREKEQAWQRQRLKQARKTAFVAVLGAIVTTGFAVWGFVERNHALKQEHIALSQKQEAEIQKQKAEHAKLDSQLNNAAWLARLEDYATAKTVLNGIQGLPASRQHASNLLNWFNKLMGSGSEYVYRGADVPLLAVAVSSDGKRLAAAGERGSLVLFDVKTGQLLQRFEGHTKNVKAVAFHPQNQWLASAGYDQKILFWSLTNDKPIDEWNVSKPILALAISPDGKYLASGGKDNNITLWDVESKKSLYTFKGHEKRIADLAFSPNGEWLASASYDNTARLWQVTTRQASHILIGHTNNVQRVAFNPDNQLLATSSKDTTVRLWAVDSGKTVRVLRGHKQTVFGVGFVENGRYLVSGSDDRTLRLWDTQSGVTMRVLQAHTAGVIGIAAFQNNLFSASKDGSVMRWNSTLPNQQAVDLPSTAASVAIAPDGNSVAVGLTDGTLRLYTLPDSQLLWEKPTAHTKHIKRIAFSPDGTLLASASHTAKLWQVKSGKLLETFNDHKDKINALAFSPDGHTLATASFDGQIGLFTVGTQQKYLYQAHDGNDVNAVSFNTSGTQLLSTSDYEVRLWNLNNDPFTLSEQHTKDFKDKGLMIWSALSQDDQQIASVGRDQTVYIYSATDKSKQYRLAGHESTIYRVIFSGGLVATASADATIRLWDLHSGSQLFSLRLPTNSGKPVPLKDFDFRCTPQGCWIAVPLLTRRKLMLYKLS
jgi:WD40 repeat protein